MENVASQPDPIASLIIPIIMLLIFGIVAHK